MSRYFILEENIRDISETTDGGIYSLYRIPVPLHHWEVPLESFVWIGEVGSDWVKLISWSGLCWPAHDMYTYVLPGDVHRGRCQVLSCRAGSGVGPSSLTGNRVPRSETRKVSALKVCPGSVPYNSMWYFRYTCGVRNYFKIYEITWLTCFRGILCFCWKFNFYQDICAVHIDSLFYLYFL